MGIFRKKRSAEKLSVAHALALGAFHGPAEFLPVSSSAHTTLVSQLFRLSSHQLPSDLKKSLEVALHSGTALALVLKHFGDKDRMAHQPGAPRTVLGISRADLNFAVATCLPSAAIGLFLERRIQVRITTTQQTAIGLAAGAIILLFVERRATSHLTPSSRKDSEVTFRDGLIIGTAQAGALLPGVSRQGATYTAARALKFTPDSSQRLADRAAIPVLIAATSLKALRLLRSGLPKSVRPAFAAGTTAAFASTLVCELTLEQYKKLRAPRFWAIYRLAIALAIALRSSSK